MSKANTNVILVQGATSSVGIAVVKELCTQTQGKGITVRAGYYSTEKHKEIEEIKKCAHEFCHLNLNNTSEVDQCLKNVTTLVIIPPHIPDRLSAVSNILDRAKDFSVKHVVLISAFGATLDSDCKCHKVMGELEKKLKSMNMTTTILRTSPHMNYLRFQIPMINKDHKLHLPLGNGAVPLICTTDIARSVCAVALNENLGMGKTLELTGPEALSGHDMAAKLSTKLGRTINYVDSNEDEWKTIMSKLGMKPVEKLEFLSSYYNWYRKQGTARVTDAVKSLTGKDPVSFESYIDHLKSEGLFNV